jgi:H+-transporting ATPase
VGLVENNPVENEAPGIVENATGSAGLTGAEVSARLRQYGPNAVAQSRPRGLVVFLSKFWGLIPWMLELAIVLDIALGRWIEPLVIAALLAFNAAIGFFQESRAEKALALLHQRLTVTARVQRDGSWQQLSAAELVPGDLVHLRVGDVMPADVHVLTGQLLVDQSQLTGESLPVECPAESTAYAGALVSRGEATGVVKATGSHTFYGKTAELVRIAESPRRLGVLILQITKFLSALVVVLALAVLAATLIRGTPLLEMLPFGLMLLVAVVPIAMPTMFTMSAALGAHALARDGILVTRLSAIEDAASMDVLCLDKTGTITENCLTVAGLSPASSTTTPDALLRLSALASDEATQDPIDLAILQMANQRGLMADLPSRAGFIPFDPGTKSAEVSIRQGGEILRIVKGAPVAIAALIQSPLPGFVEEVERLSSDGSRVLAVATGIGSNLHFAGLIALNDPPRPDSKSLIEALRNHGVRVLLITGDGEATARAVAIEVGFTGAVAPAATLRENFDSESINQFEVFAGVFPQEKFFLVQALQRAGHVVGMTGDGVNDAPALRQADVGIAVWNATDVAKAAASLVLIRPGLGEIIKAIEESRRIYQRMQTWILTMITRKIFIPPFLALGVVLFGTFVLNPTLMVLLMFATDVATMSVSTDRVSPSSEPDRWVLRSLITRSVSLSAFLMLLSGAIFLIARDNLGLSVAKIQTLVFLWLVFASTQANLYSMRTRDFFWKRPHPGRWVIIASLLDVGLIVLMATHGWLMAPISLLSIAGLLLLALVFLLSADLFKIWLSGRRTSPIPVLGTPIARSG